MKNFFLSPLVISLTLLVGCAASKQQSNSDSVVSDFKDAMSCVTSHSKPSPNSASNISLKLVGTYASGNPFDTSSAEIVSYDECADKIYVVNSQDKTVDILSFSDSGAPIKVGRIDLQQAAINAGIEIGAANSVSTAEGLVAVAIEAAVKQDAGIVALYRSDNLSLLNTYPTGALPDMVALSSDAKYIVIANEGEPNGQYTVDPEGSVTIVDLSNGYQQAVVSQVSFADFNDGMQRSGEAQKYGVRVAGPNGTTVAQDLEPEYLTIENGKAYVSLQENNAIAVVDIKSASVDRLFSLGVKSWDAKSGNQLDVSNKDKQLGNFSSYPQLVGYFMPDTITSFQHDGKTYLVTANEGDGREYVYDATQAQCDTIGDKWSGDEYEVGGDDEDAEKYIAEVDDCISFTDETRGKKLTLDSAHPLSKLMADKKGLGRIKVIADKGSLDADDMVYTFGARSFTIWTTEGEMVYDSGDVIAKKIFELDKENFNSTNDSNDSADSRSDDKGAEPEAVEVANIDGKVYIFVGLERHGGVMVFDATVPRQVVFKDYINNRDFSEPVCTKTDDGDCDNDEYNVKAGDLGPESIDYFSRSGKHYIAVGNEVSGTTTVYQIEFN
ncbi:MAG: hypothetical protein ACI90U_002469 [Pseudomonadales bacterium]|jgi:hypothetical protein